MENIHEFESTDAITTVCITMNSSQQLNSVSLLADRPIMENNLESSVSENDHLEKLISENINQSFVFDDDEISNVNSNNNNTDEMEQSEAKPNNTTEQESNTEESPSTQSSTTYPHQQISLSVASPRLPLHLFGNIPVFPAPIAAGALSNLRTIQQQGEMNVSQNMPTNQTNSSRFMADTTTCSSSNVIRTIVSKQRSGNSSRMNEFSEPMDLSSNERLDEAPSYTFSSPVAVTENTEFGSRNGSATEITNFPFTSPTAPSCASHINSQSPASCTYTSSLGDGRQRHLVRNAALSSQAPSVIPCIMFKDYRSCSGQQDKPNVLHIRQIVPVGSNYSNNMNDAKSRAAAIQQDSQTPCGTSILAPSHFRHASRVLPSRTGTTINQESNKTTSLAEVNDDINLDDSYNIFEESQTRVVTSVTESSRFPATSGVFVNNNPSIIREFGPLNPFVMDLTSENIQAGNRTNFPTPSMLPPSISSLKDKSHEALQNKLNKVLTEKDTLFSELLAIQSTVNSQQEKIKSQQKDINKLETEKNRLSSQVQKQKQKLDKSMLLQDAVFQLMLRCNQLKEENKCLKLEKNQLIKDMDALFDFYSQRCQKYCKERTCVRPNSLKLSDRVNEAELTKMVGETEQDVLFLDSDDEVQDDGFEGDLDSSDVWDTDVADDFMEISDSSEVNEKIPANKVNFQKGKKNVVVNITGAQLKSSKRSNELNADNSSESTIATTSNLQVRPRHKNIQALASILTSVKTTKKNDPNVVTFNGNTEVIAGTSNPYSKLSSNKDDQKIIKKNTNVDRNRVNEQEAVVNLTSYRKLINEDISKTCKLPAEDNKSYTSGIRKKELSGPPCNNRVAAIKQCLYNKIAAKTSSNSDSENGTVGSAPSSSSKPSKRSDSHLIKFKSKEDMTSSCNTFHTYTSSNLGSNSDTTDDQAVMNSEDEPLAATSSQFSSGSRNKILKAEEASMSKIKDAARPDSKDKPTNTGEDMNTMKNNSSGGDENCGSSAPFSQCHRPSTNQNQCNTVNFDYPGVGAQTSVAEWDNVEADDYCVCDMDTNSSDSSCEI